MVGHWSVSRQVTSRPFFVANSGNVIFVEHVPSQPLDNNQSSKVYRSSVREVFF